MVRPGRASYTAHRFRSGGKAVENEYRRELTRDIRTVLHAMRFSVEQTYKAEARRRNTLVQEHLKQVLTGIEEARLSLSVFASPGPPAPDHEMHAEQLLSINSDLMKLRNDE